MDTRFSLRPRQTAGSTAHHPRDCVSSTRTRVPVKLVRSLVVLSIFFGLALFTLVAYIILSFALDPMPDNMAFGEQLPSSSELLDEVDRELAASETRLREMERYVTSDTFTLRSRFRQL